MTEDESYAWARTEIQRVMDTLTDGGVLAETISIALLAASMAQATIGIDPETFAEILEDRALKIRADAALPRN